MGWIFLISIPIFYILGIIYLIQRLSNPAKSRRITYLKQVIGELSALSQSNEQTHILDLIQLYKRELGQYEISHTPTKQVLITPSTSIELEAKAETNRADFPAPSSFSWSNWYSDNSVNVLLYLGAFLILASAFTFVSFQWELLDGVTKSTLITVMTVTFLASGIYLYTKPRMKQAGTTFAAIGSLLIPFTGIAWYNFYFINTEISAGAIWAITSILALCVYAGLTIHMGSALYIYASSLSIFSFAASLINITDLPREFYALSGVTASFLIQSIRLYSKNRQSETQRDPSLTNSADMITSFSLLYGLIIVSYENTFYSFEVALTIFFGGLYFLFSYYQSKKTLYLAVSQFLLPLALVCLLGSTQLQLLPQMYIMSIVPFTYLGIAYLFAKQNNETASDVHLIYGLFISIAIYLKGSGAYLEPLLLFTIPPIVISLAAASLRKQQWYHIVAGIFLAIGLFLFITTNLDLPNPDTYLNKAYLIIGALYVYLSYLYGKESQNFSAHTVLAGLFFLLSFLLLEGNLLMTAFFYLTVSVVLMVYARLLTQNRLIYLSTFALSVALYFTYRFLSASIVTLHITYAPIVLSVFFTLLFIFNEMLPAIWRKEYRISAIIGLAITPLIFSSFETTPLIAAYIAALVLMLGARDKNERYKASAMAMFTYLWQMADWGYDELQVYTIPLGVYLLVLGYYQMKDGSMPNHRTLTVFGCLVLIASAFSQSFGADGFYYALLLGVEGILLLSYGNFKSHNLYRKSGIVAVVLAVLSQLWVVAQSLPRWIVIGTAGLSLLTLGVYILAKRKDDSAEP